MVYDVRHTTWYDYTEFVPFCQNMVRLSPRTTPHQRCHAFELSIDPPPSYQSRRTDCFGNLVDYFSVQGAHHGLTVTARSKIEVSAPQSKLPAADVAWEQVASALERDRSRTGLRNLQFTFPSPRVRPTEGLRAYAAASFPAGRPILQAIGDLTSRIHADFMFDPRATTVNTTLDEVLRLRRGVCQDFAHLTIGCLRSLGLGARYVSGYICTKPPPGRPRLVGADASHAWISVYCGAAGWIDTDPTNNVFIGDAHICLGWGRDYGDVCPIQGVFIGGGEHSMGVSVDVIPEEERSRRRHGPG